MSIFKRSTITLSAFSAAAIGNIVLGTNAVSTAIAIDAGADPVFYSAMRFVVSGLVLLLLIESLRALRSPHVLRQLCVSAAIVVAFLTFFSIGIELSSALKASLLSLTTPVSVYLLSIFVLGEPVIKRALVGGIIALVGGLSLVGLPIILGQPFVFGDILLLLAYFFLAASIIHAKYLFHWVDPVTVVSIRFLIGGSAVLAFMLGWRGWALFTDLEPAAWGALVYGVVVVGAVGLVFYYRSLRKIRGEDAAPLFYLDPMTGVLAAGLLLGDRLDAAAVVGAVIILVGVAIAHPHHSHLVHRLHFPHPHPWQFLHREWDKVKHKLH